MKKPIYFDPNEVAKAMRESFKRTADEAMSLTNNDSEKELVRMQDELSEVIIKCTLWQLDCHNKGANMETACEAFAITIATVVQNFAANSSDPNYVIHEIMEMVFQLFNRGTEDIEGCVSDTVSIKGKEGGNA